MIDFTGIALEHRLVDIPSAKEFELRQESSGLIQMVCKHHVDVMGDAGVEVIGKFNRNGLQYFAVRSEQVLRAKKALRKSIYSTGRTIAEDCGTINRKIIAGNAVYEHAFDRCATYGAVKRLASSGNAHLAVKLDKFARRVGDEILADEQAA